MYSHYTKAYQEDVSTSKDVQRVSYDLAPENNFKEIIQNIPIVIVDVWAKWCQPCKKSSEKFEEIGNMFKQKIAEKQILFLKDDIDTEHTFHRDEIEVVPSFFIYHHGQKVKVINGLDTNEIIHILQTLSGEQPIQNNDNNNIEKNESTGIY